MDVPSKSLTPGVAESAAILFQTEPMEPVVQPRTERGMGYEFTEERIRQQGRLIIRLVEKTDAGPDNPLLSGSNQVELQYDEDGALESVSYPSVFDAPADEDATIDIARLEAGLHDERDPAQEASFLASALIGRSLMLRRQQ